MCFIDSKKLRSPLREQTRDTVLHLIDIMYNRDKGLNLAVIYNVLFTEQQMVSC